MRQMHDSANVRRIIRPAFLGAAKVAMLSISAVTAAPMNNIQVQDLHDEEPEAEGGALWVLFAISMVLVLLGGAFAGLTIALMGQDGIYLQVISRDPEEPQRKNAKRVHDLLNKGKHWVLVTLLLSNVIVNETLPVVLDRCFGGGVAAVIGSTVLIVIFGEILPQSVCVRYGLQIGGYMSGPVLALMYAMAPVAWPTAKLLDWLLGEDHGTVYKKSGLKTLVTLHKSLGDVSERLNQDEVTIISAVLDLKRKPVEEVMTPMDDVYTMSEDTVLDEKTIDQILNAGYSRIPIHQTGNPSNFVGMLLVKILITYDPEDCKRVRDFALATLPETRPETSCLDIINFFQEGKSHMVLISEYPGEDHGTLGVVTLEDVIEELIGEEIIDESDVYVDVHRAIRRTHPAPKARVQRKDLLNKDVGVKDGNLIDLEDENHRPPPNKRTSFGGKNDAAVLSSSPRTTLLMRRSSAGHDGHIARTTVPIKANLEEMRDHFKHLGPSNPASNPRSTKVSAVKIKPGTGGQTRAGSVATENNSEHHIANGDGTNERTSLLKPVIPAKDGVQALQQTYGTSPAPSLKLGGPTIVVDQAPAESTEGGAQTKDSQKEDDSSPTTISGDSSIGSLLQDRRALRRGNVRSGSITENVVEAGGIRKVVLEATATGDEAEILVVESPGHNRSQASEEDGEGSAASGTHVDGTSGAETSRPSGGDGKKKKKKKKKGGK
ncbi:hypothetical protein PG996_014604 [Apiospora saccharicola]|uniref:CNNM transmembrane domain-containing protein n=1 Tax=Apiospora saccharicola TaxID=335842 RepID=A0ABR1TIR9_9PEZI